MYVEDKYMPHVVGINHKSIERVETKSGTRIKVCRRPYAEGRLDSPHVKTMIVVHSFGHVNRIFFTCFENFSQF